MTPNSIFYPVCALVFFTGLVAVRLFQGRITAVRSKRVHPEQLKDGKKWDETFSGTAEDISDAFENLFEIPVLFYVVAISVYVTHLTDGFYVSCAWAFVFFRVVQGVVHCTNNIIRWRMMAFFLGLFVLFTMWGRFAFQLALSQT